MSHKEKFAGNHFETPNIFFSKNKITINKKDKIDFNLRYKEDHLSNLKNLKDSLLRNNEFNNACFKTVGNILTSRESNGFRFNNVPHFVNSEKPKNLSPKYKLYQDKLLRCSSIRKDEDNLILKNIEHFENDKRLPTISNICNQNEIKNVSITINRSKIMGEKYNPLNFYHDKLKSTTKRNFYGALFQH